MSEINVNSGTGEERRRKQDTRAELETELSQLKIELQQIHVRESSHGGAQNTLSNLEEVRRLNHLLTNFVKLETVITQLRNIVVRTPKSKPTTQVVRRVSPQALINARRRGLLAG